MIEAALLLPLAKLPLDVCPVTSVTNHSRGPARTDGVRSSEGSVGQLNSASRRPGPQPERLKWGQWLDIWQLEPSGGFFTHMSGAWTQLTEAGLSLGLLTGAPVCVLSRGLGLPVGNVRKERSSDPGQRPGPFLTEPHSFSPTAFCWLRFRSPGPRGRGRVGLQNKRGGSYSLSDLRKHSHREVARARQSPPGTLALVLWKESV